MVQRGWAAYRNSLERNLDFTEVFTPHVSDQSSARDREGAMRFTLSAFRGARHRWRISSIAICGLRLATYAAPRSAAAALGLLGPLDAWNCMAPYF